MVEKLISKLKKSIAAYPDFPKTGILFRDLNPLYRDKELFKDFIEVFAHEARKLGEFDFIAGVEARGFILGAALARELGCGFIPVRKKGKLPGEVKRAQYTLEYGDDVLEIQADETLRDAKLLVIDDVYATGGTLKAVISLFNGYTKDVSVGVAMDIGIADINTLGVNHFVVLK